MNISFNSEDHIYTVDGQNIPSITQVLTAVGLIKNTEYFTKESSERGKAVHEACQLFLRNNLDMDGLHKLLIPYLTGFSNFILDSKIQPILNLCEKPIASKRLSIAGTPDICGKLNKQTCVFEIKTGDENHAQFQTAGYEILIEEAEHIAIDARYRLRLYDNGRYKLTKFSNTHDETVMRAAIIVYEEIRKR